MESVAENGTTVHIYLPVARRLGRVDAGTEAMSGFQAAKVLVMDDEEALREAIAFTISHLGHTVELAENGEQAIELWQTAQKLNRQFDVVILDLAVRDGMGGQLAMQALLKIDPRIKGIVMSGNVLDPVMVQPERHGFKGALPKPFVGRKLQDLLSAVMANPTEGNTSP